jgi:hypothetical protein
MVDLRTRLLDTLTTQFTNESRNAVTRLREGVTPYIRYVHTEQERIERNEIILAKLRQQVSSLRARSQAVIGRK